MSKINNLLKNVSDTNDYYKAIIRLHNISDISDITQYPLLTRQQLQENRYNMFSDGYYSKYTSQQLKRHSSSGSSGIPINVYWDYKDYYSSMRTLWHKRLKYYGVHTYERYVSFTLNAFYANFFSNNKNIYHKIEPNNVLNINVSCINTIEGYIKIINIINEHCPVWFYIQPFILERLIGAL